MIQTTKDLKSEIIIKTLEKSAYDFEFREASAKNSFIINCKNSWYDFSIASHVDGQKSCDLYIPKEVPFLVIEVFDGKTEFLFKISKDESENVCSQVIFLKEALDLIDLFSGLKVIFDNDEPDILVLDMPKEDVPNLLYKSFIDNSDLFYRSR